MPESRTLRRQEQMLALLAENGAATVEELAAQLDVSVWTIRRDLNQLAARGALQRLHGRAEASAPGAQAWDSATLQQAAATNLEGKQRIARQIAQQIPQGARLALAGGSTTLQVARSLKAWHFQGEVVTNALDIAVELAQTPGLNVICTGGQVQPRYLTLAGPVTERVLKLHYFDYAVIGVSGITVREGFTVNSQVEAATVNLIADHARTLIVAADHTKFGRIAFASVLTEATPHQLVTDARLAPAFAQHFEQSAIHVIIA
jgi:DeoR/GlpR family transcriptional regulator of sugar metabolism